MKLKDSCSWKKSYDKPRQHMKKQRYYFVNKGPSSQSYSFSSSRVWMWELDYKKSWVPKNWCFWTVMLEKTLESPLEGKEIKLVNPIGNQPEYYLEWVMLKLKLQYFGHLMRKADSLEKTLMLAKIEGKRRRGWQRMRWLDGRVWANSRRWWRTGKPGMLQSMGHESQTWLTDWTTTFEPGRPWIC